MKSWAKGWRIVITCNDCGLSFWCQRIGQTAECNCEKPKTIYQDANRFTLGRGEYNLKEKQVERAY